MSILDVAGLTTRFALATFAVALLACWSLGFALPSGVELDWSTPAPVVGATTVVALGG